MGGERGVQQAGTNVLGEGAAALGLDASIKTTETKGKPPLAWNGHLGQDCEDAGTAPDLCKGSDLMSGSERTWGGRSGFS